MIYGQRCIVDYKSTHQITDTLTKEQNTMLICGRNKRRQQALHLLMIDIQDYLRNHGQSHIH